jgi:hypothetical protein
MRLFRSPTLAMAIAILGVAAMLGGTLGVATAATRPLSSGFNLIGGPVSGDVKADKYVSCLPTNSWKAVYIWKADQQEWRHYFNTTGSSNVPAFVNNVAAGGIDDVPRGSGVVILTTQAVPNAFFPESQTQSCP